MSLKNTVISIFVVFVLALLLSDGGEKEYAHWTYEDENWAQLDERYNMCEQGVNQSPINIFMVQSAQLSPLVFEGKAKALNFINNGHTVQVNYKKGNNIKFNNKEYRLLQMHFHTPSENHIEGKSYPMEAHLVHRDSKNNLLVLAVMFELDNDDNNVLNKLLRTLPKEEHESKELKSNITGYELIPNKLDYYTFNGSLTTPPCTEGVRWVVLKTPVKISKNQLEDFEKVMPKNNRKIQDINGRYILN